MHVSTHHPQDPTLHHIEPSESSSFRVLQLVYHGGQGDIMSQSLRNGGSPREHKKQENISGLGKSCVTGMKGVVQVDEVD